MFAGRILQVLKCDRTGGFAFERSGVPVSVVCAASDLADNQQSIIQVLQVNVRGVRWARSIACWISKSGPPVTEERIYTDGSD